MTADHFSSSTVVQVLSWIAAVPAFCIILQQLTFLFRKQEGISRSLRIWIGLCFLFISPIRYLWFLLVLATVYPFQSFGAFCSLMGSSIFGLFALGLLYCLGVLLPLLLVYWIGGVGAASRTKRNTVAATFLAPLIALIGNLVFSIALPIAAWTTSGLNADDMIRATNGPAYYSFCCAPSGLVELPRYIKYTNAPLKDKLRAHVAFVYLSKNQEKYFLKTSYPWLFDDKAIENALDMDFKYQADGTPTLTKAERCALAILYERKSMSEEERRAYEILMVRGIVNPSEDGGFERKDQTSSAMDVQNP